MGKTFTINFFQFPRLKSDKTLVPFPDHLTVLIFLTSNKQLRVYLPPA